MTKDSPIRQTVLDAPFCDDDDRIAMMKDDLVAALNDKGHHISDEPCLTNLATIMAHSSFLARLMRTHPDTVARLIGDLIRQDGTTPAFTQLMTECLQQAHAAANADTMQQLMTQLRQAKADLSICLALADLNGLWPVDKVTRGLSDLADASTQAATSFLLRQAHAKGDLNLPDPNTPLEGCGLIILGMGKLGAHELNYSSDIDLIIFYDDEVAPYQGRKTVSEFFVRLTRDLVKVLQSMTEDGYVFRTDLRLRPDAALTSLAVPLGAAISYYESTGLNWERAAMIKARPIAGDMKAGQQFLADIRPFVWRRALDFAAIDDVQEMTNRIRRQHGQGPLDLHAHNVKLGRGGIREIEFYVQTLQMILGGRYRQFRHRATLDALHMLADQSIISQKNRHNLEAAYVFLREVEHRLQMLNDEQTQTLPKNTDELTRFANFCGFSSLRAFEAKFAEHDSHVRKAYDTLLKAGQDTQDDGDEPRTADELAQLGYADPDAARAIVDRWQSGSYRALKSERARKLAKDLAPKILNALAEADAPNLALLRFDDFLSHLPTGVQFFSLVRSHPWVLKELALLIAASPRLCRQLERRPSLLDIFIDDQLLSILDDTDEAAADLSFRLGAARAYEEQLDIARQWKNELEFLIAARHLSGRLPTQAATIDLTHLADASIQTLKPLVEAEFARQHGTVPGGELGIIAVGRLGEEQMTPQSDLDLIFVYNANKDAPQSLGTKPLTTGLYFHRLAQRIINAVSAPTAEGQLYEIDMRMRPQGRKGPIASSLDGFTNYYHNDAWIFERQALCKARVIAAPDNLRQKLESAIHRATKEHHLPKQDVHVQIGHMRDRMARAHGNKLTPFDVKLVRGGLVDIEFLAQADHLTGSTPKPLSDNDKKIINDALVHYRNLLMILRSNLEPDQISGDIIAAMPSSLVRQLCTVMGVDEDGTQETRVAALTDLLASQQTHIKSIFDSQFGGLEQADGGEEPPADEMPDL